MANEITKFNTQEIVDLTNIISNITTVSTARCVVKNLASVTFPLTRFIVDMNGSSYKFPATYSAIHGAFDNLERSLDNLAYALRGIGEDSLTEKQVKVIRDIEDLLLITRSIYQVGANTPESESMNSEHVIMENLFYAIYQIADAYRDTNSLVAFVLDKAESIVGETEDEEV